MFATGVSLLVAASFANAGNTAQLKKGGILRVGTTGISVQVDPQLAYVSTAWWLEYATAAKLYNYPDKRGPRGTRLVPEVASKFAVSNGGKTYTFFIRKGFKFSDGTGVTAKSFSHAIDRVANHWLGSPGVAFITDPKGTNIVGAKEVTQGYPNHVSGVIAKGNRLIIHLTQPDGSFMSKITMPFFQATSTKLPLDREIVNIDDITTIPSAGPYAYSRNDVNELTSIRQNPFWKRGPGRTRPRNLAGVDIQWNLNEQTAFNQVKNNELDVGPLPAAEVQGVANTYGVNKTRFWTKPVNCTGFVPMNMARPLFKDNLKLRQAVSYAVNRRAYVGVVGPYAGQPWTHLFNPGVPGWRNVNPYPLNPNLTRARQLAAGHFRDGKITVSYRSSGTINPAQAQIVRQDLINLGFEPGNIIMQPHSGGFDWDPMATADIGISMGWCSDFPDPYDWINVLLSGKTVHDENTVNYSRMNVPKWNAKMDAAANLVGPKRYKVYGQMDLDIMRQVAPMAAVRTYNNRYFFSNRVDPKSLVYQGIYSDWSIPALALK
jgi:ABC-type transport system substrate-binding protein